VRHKLAPVTLAAFAYSGRARRLLQLIRHFVAFKALDIDDAIAGRETQLF